MAWKQSGRQRPRQVGTFASRRSAQSAATAFAVSGTASGGVRTVGDLVDVWVAGKIDVAGNTRLQYEWAARHIRTGIGGVRVDRLERTDVARWLDGPTGGRRSSRGTVTAPVRSTP